MSNPTRQCLECTKEIEWSGVGRPPGRCDDCKAYQKERAREAREAPEQPKAPRRAKRAVKVKVKSARRTARSESNGDGHHGGNGKGAVKRILADLRAELAQLEERQAHLQDAIAAMERLA